MNWLSLFNGMSCGYMAAELAGLPINVYYSSEIDKHANKVTDYLFPDVIQIGDVRNIDVTKLEPIDILIGGSPCQSFSFAGKRKGMSTKDSVEIYTLEHYLELKSQGFEFEGQSYLFWEYMRILNDIRKYNPDVLFLLENVEMGEKWETILSKAIGIKGVHINSALVSAQSRKRIYWTNINKKSFGLWGYDYADIPQPKDRGILLKDILETDVAEKYYLKGKTLDRLLKEKPLINPNKSYCVNQKNNTESGSRSRTMTMIKVDKDGNPKQNQDKASCFTAGAHSGGNHSDMDLICESNYFNKKMDIKYKISCNCGHEFIGTLKDACPKCETFDSGYTNEIITGTIKFDRTDESKQSTDMICVAMRGRNPDNPNDRTTGTKTEQTLEPKTDGKTNCLTSVQKDNLIACLTPKRTDFGKEVRKKYESGEENYKRKEITSLEPRDDNKTNTISTVQKDNLIMQINPSTESGGKQPYQQNRVYDADGITPALCAGKSDLLITENTIIDKSHQNEGIRYYNDKCPTLNARDYKQPREVLKNARIRRLTERECARLQTVPEHLIDKMLESRVSSTQIYKMLGNGWTIEAIAHILKHINQ